MSRLPRHRPRNHGGRDAPPEVRHVERSDTHGILDFGWGRCTLQATAEGLLLRAEATNEENLLRIQNGIAGRLQTIGGRDGLKVDWQETEAHTPPPGGTTDTAPAPQREAVTHRRLLERIGLAAVGALAVAVHLGLGGALLAQARWAGGAADLVVVLVVVKVLVAGRFAIRRSKASKAPVR
jgi:hypothetical protein